MTQLILNLQNTPANREWFKGRVAFDARIEETKDGSKIIVKLSRNWEVGPVPIKGFMASLSQLDFVGLNRTNGKIFGTNDLVGYVENGTADIWVDKNLTARQCDLIK